MAQGMNKLNEALVSLPEVRELLLSLDAGTSPIAVSGLSGVHRAQLTAAVRHKTQRPLLIVCADENEANRMYSFFLLVCQEMVLGYYAGHFYISE